VEIIKRHVEESSDLDAEIKKLMIAVPPVEAGFWAFYQAFRNRLNLRDWLGRSIENLYVASADFHKFISFRSEHGVLAKAYNPVIDECGWETSRTVVLLSCVDMPFLVDTVRMVVDEAGYDTHISKSTILSAQRRDGSLQHVGLAGSGTESPDNAIDETFLYLEISFIDSAEERSQLTHKILTAVDHCRHVVKSYEAMVAELENAKQELASLKGTEETCLFLDWLKDSNFTFLGYREFTLEKPAEFGEFNLSMNIAEDGNKKQGIFNAVDSALSKAKGSEFVRGEADFYASSDYVCSTKSRTKCTVHRSAYPDYVIVKKFDKSGNVVGERRFLGLYTYAGSSAPPKEIPILRRKVEKIEKMFGILPESHDGKRLSRLIDIHPKDELFQGTIEQLYESLNAAAELDERDVVRLLIRTDPFARFTSCLAYIPREYFTTDLRLKIQHLVGDALNTSDSLPTTFFSESKHARAHIVYRMQTKDLPKIDVEALEKEVTELTLGWQRRLRRRLRAELGESEGTKLYQKYVSGIPQGYQEHFEIESAVNDLKTFENLKKASSIALNLYRNAGTKKDQLQFRVSKRNSMIELSDVIPILENMGLRVLGESPYKIVREDDQIFWIHDFQLKYSETISDKKFKLIEANFEEAFERIWEGDSDSDSFNQLIPAIGVNWREVNLLRAYANYMKQTQFTLTLEYIADALVQYPDVTKQLLSLFSNKFDPRLKLDLDKRNENFNSIQDALYKELETFKILNQEKVYRRYIDLIAVTTRVSFYQRDQNGAYKAALSLKLQPKLLDNIPEPKPAFEFFVYSSRIEGVHLRTSKVARGGLRWSDRQEDYRTEVLGLVKAQQVKNSVIVPSGAKGGFVAKKLPTGSRAKFLAEGVECYKIFIRGLLDLTDNLVEAQLVKPFDVVSYDGDDAYLVVAADKGTATFSDIANEISIEKGHWLGDAFASGGSQGYDHKAMGITAKGAWVSVQRHFRELGIHTQQDPFTALAIGDMGGDVFGNGMLCSDKIKLVAAFNHLHIFIDPDPDPATSYAERERLFGSTSAGWTDYDASLISKGGGVFSRSDKFIRFSPEIKQLLQTDLDKETPENFINLLLKAPIDLIWNGGIGTYVKSELEQHSDVGDRANDHLRVNGSELRCKMFGEGGNLGMTQLGRIEFGLNGGACNTDFIDNSAGVDCSDHEVNIKILIDAKVQSGELSEKDRNQLLVDMTDSVSSLVLKNNYKQTLLLSVCASEGTKRANEYRRFIEYLEELDRLDRKLEYLPGNTELSERIAKEQSLTRAELSVLMSYAKVQLKEELAKSDIADDAVCGENVFNIFPERLHNAYRSDIQSHKLRKEIISTQLANGFVNDLGITAFYRIAESTGSIPGEIVKAYVVARNVFKLHDFQESVYGLDYTISADEQHQLLLGMMRRVRRATGWFLKNRRGGIHVSEEIDAFSHALSEVQTSVSTLNTNKARQERWAAMPNNLYSGLSVVEVRNVCGASLFDCTAMFYQVMDELSLNNFANLLAGMSVESMWQASAREAHIDELETHLRKLASTLLKHGLGKTVDQILNGWLHACEIAIERWKRVAKKVESNAHVDFAMCSVALRELSALVQATQDAHAVAHVTSNKTKSG